MPILDWIGKKQVINHDKEVPFRLLKRVHSLSVGESENLIIKGDNLEALKALLPYYYNKVKCIYIDPPYNTGNENWIYNDKVNSPEIKKWLGRVVGSEGEDLSRHDKWLCMMYPRLRLLKELLSNDGVIFISIDDNEQGDLLAIADDIFHGCHIGTFIWESRSGKGGTVKNIAIQHEYVIAFAKNKNMVKIKPVEKQKEGGTDEDEKGLYTREQLRQWGQGDRREDRPSMFYPIYTPTGKEVWPIKDDGTDGRWRVGKKKMKELLEQDDVDFVYEADRILAYKKIREGKVTRSATGSLLLGLGTASHGTIEIKRIFGEKVFPTAKPTTLIEHLISLITYTDKDSIILDSFAGSGTTAHAVLELNKEDGGNRKFILVEMEDEIARKVTAERVKRVIKGYTYKNSKVDDIKVEGLGGGFQFMNLDTELFDAHGLINNDIDYTDLARYIFFSETKLDLKEKAMKDYFIGERNGTEYYLIYKQGKENILNEKTASKLKKTDKEKIVYADNCTLDSDTFDELNIIFKQIPYEVRGF